MGDRPKEASTALYVKTFLVQWLVAALLGGAIVMLGGYDWARGTASALVLGAVFALPMSILLVRRLTVLQGGASTRPTAAKLSLAGSYDEVFARCRTAVSSLPDAALGSCNPQESRIVARVGGVATGQRIQVLLSWQQTRTAVTIESRPRNPLLLFDYGQNERNVKLVVEVLRRGA
jgi:hypothetical protein